MNAEFEGFNSVAIVPRRPVSRVQFGEEAILAPKAEFEISINQAGEEPARLAAVHSVMAESNARDVLDGIVGSSDARTRRFPRSASAWIPAGFAHLARGDDAGALHAFETALELEPGSRSAQLGLARAANQGGDAERATKILRGLRNTYPNDAEVAVALAVVLSDYEGSASALDILRESPPTTPRNASFFAARGSLWVAAGEYERAIKDLRTTVRLKPDWAHARNVLGIAELKAGHAGSAERRFREAARVAPMYLEGFLNLLRLFMHQRRFADALALVRGRFEDVVAAPAGVGRIAGQAAIALDDWPTARSWLESALGKTEDLHARGRLQNDLGVVFCRLGRFAEAEKLFMASVESMPTELAIVNRAKALFSNRSALEAAAWLRATPAPDNSPDSERLGVLAIALNAGRRHDDAASVYENLISRGGAGETAYGNLVAIYTDHLANLERAIKVARDGLDLYPRSALLINNLAYAQLMDGDVAGATTTLGREMEFARDAEKVYLAATRGLLAIRAGDIASGRRLYDEALGMSQTRDLRERVRAKRDLEFGRALARLKAPADDIAQQLLRASTAGAAAYPYDVQATDLLRRLKSGHPVDASDTDADKDKE